MAAAQSPTLRQKRLGAELRKLRERSGLSSTAAAAEIGVPQARISMIEGGRYRVSAERVRAMARVYACDDSELVEALTGLTGGRSRGWWDEYRELLPAALVDVAEVEHHATALRAAVVVTMPGLVQILDHTRAALAQNVPRLLPHEIEHRASFRIKRQAILHRSPAVPYTAIIHEAALRMGFGGPDVTRTQLEFLIEAGQMDNTTILVVPFGLGDYPASGQPISYVSGPVPQLDTVILDSDHGCTFLDAEAQVSRYRSILDRMESCALTARKSRDLIRRIARDA
ncbi:helix-turn-helix domain-containing protein [Streptomyces carpaticus]|uniref:Helix-turn-helix transcriptional regulator n=1 Tax=Streptomyces carpaticus TaxID=285558 RepID=A0ABV4ZPG7_9ACTN